MSHKGDCYTIMYMNKEKNVTTTGTRQKWLVGLGVIVLLVICGYGVYRLKHSHAPAVKPAVTKTKPSNNDNDTKKSETAKIIASSPPAPDKDAIKNYSNAGLFNASFTKHPTDFTPWNESPVNVEYRDLNDDGVIDAFVWAQPPGTAQNSYAAVWTTNATNQPIELWHVPDNMITDHSTWLVDVNNGLEQKSLNNDASIRELNVFHWQVTTDGKGFVLDPNIQ